MNTRVRIHLDKAVLIGGQRYSKVLIGRPNPTADTVVGRSVSRSFTISGYVFSYQYHELMTPMRYDLAESNILAVSNYPEQDRRLFAEKCSNASPHEAHRFQQPGGSPDFSCPGLGYSERNAHEFLARQLFAVPDESPVSRQQRDDAKKISLGLGYGMGEIELASLLHRPVHQVTALLDRYLSFLGIDRAEPWRADRPVKQCSKNYSHAPHNHHRSNVKTTCPGRGY